MKQAGVALIIKDGLILAISRRNNKSLFGLPGGKFDEGVDKDTKDTAIRETLEETSVLIKDCELIFERLEPDGFQARCYYVLDWEGTPSNNEEGEVKWLTAIELTSPTMGAFADYNTATLKVFKERYPDIKIEEGDPYDLGWYAGYHDECVDCPYPENSPEAKEWRAGFDQGNMDC